MNLPIDFRDSKRILFAGIGGGFDIFTALPLWVRLRRKRSNFVLSNYNGLAKEFTSTPETYPEKELSQILKSNEFNVPVYVIPKLGVKLQAKYYQQIVEDNEIDTVIAVDGGVDSLMQGDEANGGTMLEDFISLTALGQLKNVKKYLVCAGFGAEVEEGLCHYQVLESMSLICRQGGFLGSCSLLQDEEFDIYKQICEWVWKKGRKSHIQTRIISSAMGAFGEKSLYDNIEANVASPSQNKCCNSLLSSIYWFFDLETVLKNNKLKHLLESTNIFTDALMLYRQFLSENILRAFKSLPY